MEKCEQTSELLRLSLNYINLRHSQSYQRFDKRFESKEYNSMLVLAYLVHHKDNVFSHNLSEALERSTPQMAVLLKHMESEGFIQRVHDEDDGRRTEIKILPAGEKFYEETIARCESFITQIFELMGQDKAMEFVSLFNQFLEACSTVCRERSSNDRPQRKASGNQG